MLAVSQRQKRAFRSPVWRQDTRNQRSFYAGADVQPIPMVLSGVSFFVFSSTVTGDVTLTNISVPAFSSEDAKFRYLLAKWHRERGASSSITKIAMCPSYQKIIAMGPAAVPLILRELEREGDEPDHWFWALQVMTGADPVPEEARGDMVAMARAWLRWGRQRYAW